MQAQTRSPEEVLQDLITRSANPHGSVLEQDTPSASPDEAPYKWLKPDSTPEQWLGAWSLMMFRIKTLDYQLRNMRSVYEIDLKLLLEMEQSRLKILRDVEQKQGYIMGALERLLGLDEVGEDSSTATEELPPDDTPQPNNNLSGNPYR